MEKELLLESGDLLVPCKIAAPDGRAVRQVVLGVHGLGGSMEDDIQSSIAEEMVMFSCASVRFDMPCHGKSPLADEGFTLENCKFSLLAAATHARKAFPEAANLCIFATGFGAYVTLVSLPELLTITENIRLVIQTPSLLMHSTLLSMIHMSQETLRSMDFYRMMLERPLTIRYSFYQELLRHNIMFPQPIPMLILHGEHDDYIPMEHIQNFRRINEDAKLVIIPGASHRFLEDGAWDMVLDLTRDWFEFQQVLLMDYE